MMLLLVKVYARPGQAANHRRWCIVNQASHTFALNLVGFAHYIASEGGVIGRAPFT
jgi:hypothetical protein